MRSKNFRFVFTLYFIIFGITIALFGSLVGYKIQMIDIQERIDKNAEEVAFNKKNNLFKPIIDKMDAMVFALSKSQILFDYLQNPDLHNTLTSNQLFLTIIMSDKQVMQARFIDAEGKEKIRVDRLNESSLPFIVDPAKLQNKSTRDYFQIVRTLPNETIWHSKLDLNIENGKVEIPFRPTIRIATPIYRNGTFKGIVIVNMLTNNLLSSIRTSAVFEHYIIDKEGNIIIAPDDTLSWSKYTGKQNKLTDIFPNETSKILAGTYTGKDFYTFTLNDVLHNDDDAILILKPKTQYEHSLVLSNIQSAILVVILSILVSIPLALYASITPSKLQKALLASNSELKRFAGIIDKYVVTVTTKTNSIITAVSSAFEKVTGYDRDELIGRKINLIKHPDTSQQFHNTLWRTIENGEKWQGEVKNIRKDGHEYWLEQTIIPIQNDNGDITSYVSVATDITDKKELEKISVIDQLTGIFNRRKLNDSLQSEVNKAHRYHRPLSVLIMDIDHFKRINDTYGHQCGDFALTTVAALLSKHIRDSDIVGRYGGEEFMVICPETQITAAVSVGEKLREAIAQYDFGIIGHITISIGVAELKEEDTLETIVKNSDNCLYTAKHNGRNQVVAES
ncbi:MAG: GGDEF domain-containing protein [Sulfuricurvum sp.]|uniref:sensor domain-containing diguanylate cyclase n=1 Tax=Sulfuricurvum sp. TaxID=2025608 RepID=UPI003D0F56AF